MNKPHIQINVDGWLVWDHLDQGRFFLCEDWDSVVVLTEAMASAPLVSWEPESVMVH